MSTSQIPGERVRIPADEFLAAPTTPDPQLSLGAALLTFMDTPTKTALHRAELVSKSALSRLLNGYSWDTEACWRLLEQAQWDCLRLTAKGKHRPLLRLSADLTSVQKKGSALPFVRVEGEVLGIRSKKGGIPVTSVMEGRALPPAGRPCLLPGICCFDGSQHYALYSSL